MKKLTNVGMAFILGLFALGSFFITSVRADEGCGEIVYLAGGREFIDDCENPFGTVESEAAYELLINDTKVESGGNVTISEDGVDNYYVSSHWAGHSETYYRHDGANLVEVETSYVLAIEADYREYAQNFFGNVTNAEPYIQMIMGNDVDTESPDWDWDLFYGFEYYFSNAFRLKREPLLPGTYTLVIEEHVLILSDAKSWLDHIKEVVIPTAYAFEFPSNPKYSFTFTLMTEEVEGAPSVLFFPGIMGSRLYEESSVCNVSGGADQVERWFSFLDCDIERLSMNESGESINFLYTEAEGGVIRDVYKGSNLYDSLFEDFEQLKDEGKIANYRDVPYDWRMRLSDILRAHEDSEGRIIPSTSADYKDGYIYKSLEAMVVASPSKKVVLVGHSNGGLVIKTLLATMKADNDPLLDSVEKVVLVAVPQAGTPEAILGMLHGVEIGNGFVITKEQTRKLINTSPFGYHLLPTKDYFDMVDTPVITIKAGTSTDAWRAEFGDLIDAEVGLEVFLGKESGRPTPAWDNLLTPATAYSSLLSYAKTAHNFMFDWQPAETKVYEVAGTGIYTPATINYFTDTECVRYDSSSGQCAETAPKLGYWVSEVKNGDGTVVTPSALAVPLSQGSEKWFIDLKKSGSIFDFPNVHKNIFEVQQLIDFVSDIIFGSDIDGYSYISNSEPVYPDEDRLVYQLHSPLDLYVILHDGEVVGSSTSLLRGVEYRRYGELQQLSIPEGETGYEIRLSGIATGSFTLDVDLYEREELIDRQTYSAVPSSTSTQVSLNVEEGEEVVLKIDYQGDGVFEAIVLPGLAIIVPATVPTTTTPVVLRTKSSSSGTKVGVRGLPSAPLGVLSGGEVTTVTQHELTLQLITLLTRYRDLLIKLKVQ